MTDSSPTNLDYTREVRFAVVMYGGVSLAIYINGVAQELLHLVRATANRATPDGPLDEKGLSGSERVYRKLGYVLAQERVEVENLTMDLNQPGPTRFVVDTIAG